MLKIDLSWIYKSRIIKKKCLLFELISDERWVVNCFFYWVPPTRKFCCSSSVLVTSWAKKSICNALVEHINYTEERGKKKKKKNRLYIRGKEPSGFLALPFRRRFGWGRTGREKESAGRGRRDMTASGGSVKMATAAADYAAVRTQNNNTSLSTNNISFSDRCEKYFAELNRWYVFTVYVKKIIKSFFSLLSP